MKIKKKKESSYNLVYTIVLITLIFFYICIDPLILILYLYNSDIKMTSQKWLTHIVLHINFPFFFPK